MGYQQQLLQGLLYINDGLEGARWNFPLAIGSSLDQPAGIGKPARVSYSFPSTPPSDYDWGQGFRSFDVDARTAAINALHLISTIANIRFEAASSAARGSIRFGFNTQNSNQAGYAYSPSYAYSIDSNNTILSVTEEASGGDVWLNNTINYSSNDYKPGGSGFASLLHELGHAIGLKHPFEGTTKLSRILDSNQYTLMSYTPHPRAKLVQFSQTRNADGINTSWTTTDLDPRSLMLGDIAAIQQLYGANRLTHAGSTSYRFRDSDIFFETIWDGSGNDTIDCSAMSQPNLMSLAAGSFSSIGLRNNVAALRALHRVPAEVDQKDLDPNLYNGSNNLAIAYGCDIENAIGGSANDTITGNALANMLQGGRGADQISGGGGADLFRYRAIGDSPAGAGRRDQILDFNRLQGDRIDLQTVDADPNLAGRQAFRYIGSAGFSGSPGEVRFANGLLQANTTSDTRADLEILLRGVSTFARSDLIA